MLYTQTEKDQGEEHNKWQTLQRSHKDAIVRRSKFTFFIYCNININRFIHVKKKKRKEKKVTPAKVILRVR